MIYTAVLPEGYVLKEGVALPTINVMVGKQAMAATAMPRAATDVEVADGFAIQKAIDSATGDTTIKLTQDIPYVNSTLQILDYNTHNFTLDLNGHTLKAPRGDVIQNSSPTILTIKDSSGTAGTISAYEEYPAIRNYCEGATLNIYDVTIQSSGKGDFACVIDNDGTLNIYSGTVQGTGKSKAIANSGTANISGGTVQAENNAALSNAWGNGKYIISGTDTKITSAATGDNGTIFFSGELGADYQKDILIINGGTITNTASPEGYSVYFAADTGVTGDNRGDYYTKTDGTVGKVFPIPTAPKISFDARNGVAIGDAKIDKVSGTITMPATNPTWGDNAEKNNYTFAGWYTDIDGAGTVFKNENLTASKKVYAKWTKGGKAVLTEPLDLTGGNNLKGEGWKWDNTTKTLTLDGIILNSSKLDKTNEVTGIIFPKVDCTIILVDGTENTVDVSSAKNSSYSVAIYSVYKLNIKTSGKGTPGKLNAIAGNATDPSVGSATDPSVGIYANGGIVIESGNITATAGDSANDNSLGMSADMGDIHIKGGTVTAIGGKSGGTGMEGSFGMYGTNVQIDDGKVTATGGDATLSAGIVGAAKVKLNGGSIHAKGTTAAVAALTNPVVVDDIANVTVNGKPAEVGTINIGMDISTLVNADKTTITDAAIKFKPNYTGTNPLAPNAPSAIKTSDSITLPTQKITGETVEYGIENSGTITWQDSPIFKSLVAGTEYTFYNRVKANDTHKAGTTSGTTTIKTKKAPANVSGTVKDKDGNALDKVSVTLKQGNKVITEVTTANGGKYTLTGVPEGVYSLVIKNGKVTITETVIVEGTEIIGKDIKFLDGNKNTVVESKPGTPEVAVDKMNDLLNATNFGTTLTLEEQTVVNGNGSVELKFTANLKTAENIGGDKGEIEKVAKGQKIDLLLDLSVLKTVKDNKGDPVTTDKKVETLAQIIEIHLPIPADLQGKAELSLYRMHKGNAEKLGKDAGNANSEGEYYTIDLSGTFMTVHVKNFSTYAFGYKTFTVTIADGGTGASGAGNHSNGDIVTINAGSKSGYSFNGWTVTTNNVALANSNSASTSFVMPTGAVVVTAGWTYTGGGGGGGGGSSSSNYYYIKATAGPGGSMSTAEKVKVRTGESVSFTITPDKGYQIEDVLVNGKSIGAKNTYEFTKVYSDQTIHATFKKVGDNTPQTGVSFKDVKENDWCYDAIMKATAKGWFSGISATTFSPNAPTTRGMIAAILHRMDGTPKANAASFNDVAADVYYANGIAWAETNNIVRGYGNGSYGPNANITREQLASILYRYASHKGYDASKTATLDSFTDSKSVSGYAKEAMSWAVGSGLISGRGNNALAPTANATRAEVAVILVRFDELFIK